MADQQNNDTNPEDDELDIGARIVAGGLLLGGLGGAFIGAVITGFTVIPVAVAVWGHSLLGWAGAAAGLAAGAVINFTPLKYLNPFRRKEAETEPDSDFAGHMSPRFMPDMKGTKLSDVLEDVGGIAGGLTGAFAGAALGGLAALIVKSAEARTALYKSGDHGPPRI